uniref:Uncharacterized protein n=1 Tax=Panagrolaimus sp. JU765 TaxID=591449 RepID=A0AC34RAT9_9BILA
MTRTYDLIYRTKKEYKRQWAQVILLLELSIPPKERLMALLKYSRPIGVDKKKRGFVVTKKTDMKSLSESDKLMKEQQLKMLKEEKLMLLKRRLKETHELSKGHGTAHLLVKCQLCSRVNSLEILTDSYKAYSVEKNEEWQPIVKFDCRGLEPVDFDPRVGWRAIGVESGTVFEDIDLHDKEWADYDEKVNEPVEINNIGSRFIKTK